MAKKKEVKVNLQGFFEQGFEAKDWVNIREYKLPVLLKYMEHDKFTGKYGETNRIFFQDSDGREVRLLVRGNTFISALEAYISTGEKILVFKNEKGYWMFDLPSE